MKYQKINTLWKRAEIGNKIGRIIEGDVSNDEFKEIKKWDVTEKIDGMNIRVNFSNNIVTFDGRTDNAQIPAKLYKELQTVFTFDRMQDIFGTASDVTLFGEGYGPNINGGGAYRDTPGFILFDVQIGEWWLLRTDVDDIASHLGIKSVPYIGYMDTDSIVRFVKSNPNSVESNETKLMEGVVCRTKSMLLSRDGTPLMWKLKCKDYLKRTTPVQEPADQENENVQ